MNDTEFGVLHYVNSDGTDWEEILALKGEDGKDGKDGKGVQTLTNGQGVEDVSADTIMAFSFTEGSSDVSYYSRTQSDLLYVKKSEKGVSNGLAVLDANGKLAWSQMPTSIYYIAGAIDASNEHQLPDASNHTDGAQIIVTSEGYVEQSTMMTLTKGSTLTEFEVYSANTLISAGYTFTLKSGTTTLGTVTSFETNRVNLSNSTSISLPYTADLTAISVPATIQVACASGDVFMLIDGHWQHLSNSTYVTSVNNKTGAVVLTLNELGGTKQWYGYQADYDAIATKDPTMDYNIYEE